MENTIGIKHPALFYLYTGGIIIGAALVIPQLLSLSNAACDVSVPAVAVLAVIVFLLNIMQYAMSDDFSFSLAIIPELIGLFLFGPTVGLLLIMITLLTNITYRFITKENSMRESLFKFFLNAGFNLFSKFFIIVKSYDNALSTSTFY